MTPDQRKEHLRAELAALGVPADDITHRLLDRVDHYTRQVDLDCMFAVETILALRDQVAACRTIIEASDSANEMLGKSIDKAKGEIDEIKRQLEIVRDMLPEEFTDV